MDDYRLVFIVSISLLHTILNARQNKIHRIVAYAFRNVCEKNHQFLSSIRKHAHKRKLVPFFLPHGIEGGSIFLHGTLVHGNSTAVLVTSSTMTFTGWMFPDVPSSNCAWLCINVCTAQHRSTSPSCAFRLRMLPDAVNYVLLAEDFWIFLVTMCHTMVDVRSVSPVLTSGIHFLSISGNQHK